MLETLEMVNNRRFVVEKPHQKKEFWLRIEILLL